jgi:hypothetical protein
LMLIEPIIDCLRVTTSRIPGNRSGCSAFDKPSVAGGKYPACSTCNRKHQNDRIRIQNQRC